MRVFERWHRVVDHLLEPPLRTGQGLAQHNLLPTLQPDDDRAHSTPAEMACQQPATLPAAGRQLLSACSGLTLALDGPADDDDGACERYQSNTFAPTPGVSSLGMLAVVFDVGLRPQDVGDLFLRARRDGLVDFELWDGRVILAGSVLLREVLVMGRHGESFGRRYPQRMPIRRLDF